MYSHCLQKLNTQQRGGSCFSKNHRIILMKFQNYRSFARQRKILCALTAESVRVNRAKPEELLGRILSSLLSLHCILACTAPQYLHNTVVLVLLSPCNPPFKLVEGCQRLTYLFKLSHQVITFQFFSSWKIYLVELFCEECYFK